MSPAFCILVGLILQVFSQGGTDDGDRVLLRNLTDNEIAYKRQGIFNLKKYITSLAVVEQHVAPVTVQDGPNIRTIVDMMLTMGSVLSLDDTEQTIRSSFFVQLSWQDSALAWNASDFHGVHAVEVPVNTVWTPHIFIVNAMETGNILLKAEHLTISNEGTVFSAFVFISQTLCNMDHGRFPYDTQHCSVIFHSMSQQVDLDLKLVESDNTFLETFVRKSEWEMVRKVTEEIFRIPFLHVELRRKTTFYTICLVVPMVLTSYMNTLVFLVPLEAGEKVSFLVSIFISTSVFTSFFTSVMPRGLDVVPASMKLLVGVTTESLVLLVCTLLVMWRYHSSHTAHHSSGASPHQSSHQPDTAHSSKAGGGGRQWCCSSHEGLGEVRVEPEKEQDQEGQASQGGSVRHGLPALTAQHLDRLFFLVSFLANTVFMCVLFFD